MTDPRLQTALKLHQVGNFVEASRLYVTRKSARLDT